MGKKRRQNNQKKRRETEVRNQREYKCCLESEVHRSTHGGWADTNWEVT